jgi:hypothetical protein
MMDSSKLDFISQASHPCGIGRSYLKIPFCFQLIKWGSGLSGLLKFGIVVEGGMDEGEEE